jgi:anti-sigma-K factor RskA
MAINNHVTDLIPAYALGSLDEDEARLVENHLASCSTCQAELRSYQAVAGQLSLAVPETDPPADLKQRLLARVQEVPATTADAQAKPSWHQQLITIVQRALATPVWRPVALILILALIAANLLLWQRAKNTEKLVPAGFQTVNLSGTAAAPGAQGVIVISDDGQHGTLIVENMPELGQELEYQLWLIKGDQRTSGGIFSVSEDGYRSIWVKSPRPLADYSDFGVTIEPAGGSPGPTGDKVLGGQR